MISPVDTDDNSKKGWSLPMTPVDTGDGKRFLVKHRGEKKQERL